MKAALPLAEILAIVACQSSKTGPWSLYLSTSWQLAKTRCLLPIEKPLPFGIKLQTNDIVIICWNPVLNILILRQMFAFTVAITILETTCMAMEHRKFYFEYHKNTIRGSLTRYVKLWVAHAPRMSETFPPPPTSKETTSSRSCHASRLGRHARALMHGGIANPRWRGKLSRHSRRMRNPQFYVSGKLPISGYPIDASTKRPPIT